MRHHTRGFHARILSTCSALALGVSVAAMLSQPALAQEVIQVPEEAEEALAAGDRVVVTGSRIQRQDFTANSPIVTIDQSTFEETSTIGIETVLNQLPQFVPALSQFTAGDIQPSPTNTVGSSTVSLRGLGSNRSLVLVDGRRATPINATLVVDTNSIPSSAVQRTEIISGGASAVYGADAVGGVVNFILRDNFEGFQLDTRYGITELGDSSQFQVSGLFGANLANGRGNVMFALEHATRGWADQNKRDWRVEELADPFVTGTDIWHDGTYFTSRSAGNQPTFEGIARIFPELGIDPTAPANTQPIPRTAQFYINRTPDGTGTVYTGVRNNNATSGVDGAYKYAGGFEHPDYPGLPWRKIHPDGSIGQNNLMNFLSRPMERWSSFGRGRFALTDNIDIVAMGTFARTKGTTVSQSTAALGSNSVIIPYGNELYEPSVDANGVTLPAYRPGGLHGLNCPEFGGCTQSEAFPLPEEVRILLDSRDNPNDDIHLNTTTHYMPNRQIFSSTVTYQAVLGLEGRLQNDWVWDFHASHGETLTDTTMIGDISRERYRAVASSPNFGRGFYQAGNEEQGGARSGVGTCTTGLPLIADFIPSDDCIQAIAANLFTKQTIMQNALEANLAGDAFDLPAGPLSFAVGASFREYDFEYYVDNLNRFEAFIEQTMGARPSGDSFGYYSVSEVYGELLVPVISDVPFIQHFNLELGGRYSDYSTVGGVWTYKVLGDWAITDWARLRGGLNIATRAPNIAELYMSRVQTFGGSGAQMGDQCSMRNQNGLYGVGLSGEIDPDTNQFVWDGGYNNVDGEAGHNHARAICEALMGPTGAAAYYDRPIEQQPAGGGVGDPNAKGNPDVQPENAETWTAGLVLRSPFENRILSGLTASIDYFRIDLKDMIAFKTGDDIYQECLSLSLNPTGDLTIPACEAIVRDFINGNPLSVDIDYTNEGRAITEGIDVQLSWRGQFEDIGLGFIPGGLALNVLGTYNLTNSTQSSPNANVIDWRGTRGCALGLGCMGFNYRVFTTLNYFHGPISASLRWQHYPSIESGAYATNRETTAVGVTSYNVFALSGAYRLANNINLRAGIDNLFNTLPPYGGGNPDQAAYPVSQVRQGGGTYDPLGRRFWGGLSVTF